MSGKGWAKRRLKKTSQQQQRRALEPRPPSQFMSLSTNVPVLSLEPMLPYAESWLGPSNPEQKLEWIMPTSYSMVLCVTRKPSNKSKERKMMRKPRWIGNKVCYGK